MGYYYLSKLTGNIVKIIADIRRMFSDRKWYVSRGKKKSVEIQGAVQDMMKLMGGIAIEVEVVVDVGYRNEVQMWQWEEKIQYNSW